MRAYFTARHKDALDGKKLKPSLANRLRQGIERVLAANSDCGGWNDAENFTYDVAGDRLRTFYGGALRAYKDDQLTEASFREVLLNGWPPHVLDGIEAWFEAATDNDVDQAGKAEAEVNQLLAVHRSEWRFVNGLAIRVDSEYLHEEIVAKSLLLMSEAGFAGAQEEFQAAIAQLESGECKQAVIEAHKSGESTMKAVLGVAAHETFGSLLARIVKSTVVPEYYHEFLKHFEKLALGAVKERNLPGRGHGQGVTPQTVSPALAQFALHLAGAINVFLVERWVETQPKKPPRKKPQPELEDDDIPF